MADDNWHYVANGQSVGPISLSELSKRLRAMADWKEQLVWRPGMVQWASAGTVPELAPTILPPIPSSSRVSSPPQKPEQTTAWPLIAKLASAGGLIVVLLAAALGGQIGKQSVRYLMQPSQEQREAALKAGLDKALTQIKAQLPRKIDNATTLVDAVIEGATFSYYYMLDDTLAQPSRDLVRGKVCTSDMIKSMQIGARYRYVYTNLQGKPLAEFELGQDDCTKP